MKMLPSRFWFLILFQAFFQLSSSMNILKPLNGLKVAQLHKKYSLICHWGPGSVLEWKDSDGKSIDIKYNCKSSGKRTTKLFKDAIVSCNHSTKTSILEIKNITKTHNGTSITCITDQNEEEFQLKVSDQTPYLIMSLSKTEIYNGQNVDVRCHWNLKNQEMKVKLMCGEKNISRQGSVFLNLNMTKEWNKKYCLCEGFHYGNRIVTYAPINVYYAPQISVNNLTVVAGMMAVMNCSVTDGNPENFSYIEWHHIFKNVLLEKRQPSNEDGSLVIPNVTWQDAGIWVCFVTNGKGNSSSYGTLSIAGPPILQASSPNVEAISGTSKKLEVYLFPVYENIVITWMHNGQKISKGTPGKALSSWQQKIKGQEVYISGLTVSLALNDLQESDSGNYSVSAFTKHGKSFYTFELKISSRTDMTLVIVGIICGTLAVIIFIIFISCCFFCSQQQKHHSSIIDTPMSTPRTRIFSIPKKVSLDYPTSDLELDIYEEIDDWNSHDLKKKEDGYLNPAMIRYAGDPVKSTRMMESQPKNEISNFKYANHLT